MSELKRYDIFANWLGGSQCEIDINQSDSGEWVKHSEARDSKAEIICKLGKELDEKDKVIEQLHDDVKLLLTLRGSKMMTSRQEIQLMEIIRDMNDE